jgi:hypothetical protein
MKEYLARRARRPLEALKPEHEVSDVLEHATVFLADLPAAREAATDQKCNALARLPCEEVRIESDWVAAVKPQPILVPYVDLYYQSQCISSGSDGGWTLRYVILRAQYGWPLRRIPHPSGATRNAGPASWAILNFRAWLQTEPKVPRSASWQPDTACPLRQYDWRLGETRLFHDDQVRRAATDATLAAKRPPPGVSESESSPMIDATKLPSRIGWPRRRVTGVAPPAIGAASGPTDAHWSR